MTEGTNPTSDELVRMTQVADQLPDRDDETAGTPEHNLRADLLAPQPSADSASEDEPMATQPPEPLHRDGKEGTVNEAAVSAGEGALAETVQRISVTEADANDTVVDSNTDSATQQLRKENLVDKDTSRARAYVEKEKRNLAASHRELANAIEWFEPTDDEKELEHLGRRRFNNENKDNPAFNDSNEYYVTKNALGSPEEKREQAELQRYEASRLDKAADGLGDWAETLHKNPPSEELKNKYPEVEFTPEAMVDIERIAANHLKTVEIAEEALQEMSPAEALFGLRLHDFDDNRFYHWTVHESLQRLGEDSVSKEKEWGNLISSGNTTLSQLKEFYTSLIKRVYLDGIKSQATINQAFLDEIKGEEDTTLSSAISSETSTSSERPDKTTIEGDSRDHKEWESQQAQAWSN